MANGRIPVGDQLPEFVWWNPDGGPFDGAWRPITQDELFNWQDFGSIFNPMDD